jgi:hypothetical protein
VREIAGNLPDRRNVAAIWHLSGVWGMVLWTGFGAALTASEPLEP